MLSRRLSRIAASDGKPCLNGIVADIRRRGLLELGLFSLAAASLNFRQFAHAAPVSSVRLGAIRWDAWYGPDTAPKSSEWYAAHDLDPPQYHFRAPWFARLAPDNHLVINGTQSDMDAELVYAAQAGLKFWAFGWYQPDRPLHRAWTYYQNSPNKAMVNWCVLIGTGSLAAKFPPVNDLVGYFMQPTYECYGSRPLLFVMHERAALETAATALTALRATCAVMGAGNPYVVLQSSVAKLAASDMVAIGADAIGAYAQSPGNLTKVKPYRELAAITEAFDYALVATGKPAVPLIMTGWDRRPRSDHPPPFDPDATRGFVEPGAPSEIASHVVSVVAAVRANQVAYPAQRALIYSWNECDEGGSVLIPTWTPKGPNVSILNAVAAAML